MNQETVTKFFEAVRKDAVATEKLRAVADNVDEFGRMSVRLGRERGFVFEPADVQGALDALATRNTGELSEGDLSAVAGGVGMAPITGTCAAGQITRGPGLEFGRAGGTTMFLNAQITKGRL